MAAKTPAQFAAMMDADFLKFDGLETVTFKQFQPLTETLATGVAVTATRRAIGRQEVDAGDGGKLLVVTVRWHLRAAELDDVIPAKRSQIIQTDLTTWVVDSVQAVGYSSRYVCECHQKLQTS